MATKTLAAWKKEAQALSKQIGKEVEIAEDAKIEDVQKLVADLEKELETAKGELANAVEEKQPETAFEYSVAHGKSITSKRGRKGMLHAGEEVKADDLGGGVTALTALVKKGVVVHNPKAK